LFSDWKSTAWRENGKQERTRNSSDRKEPSVKQRGNSRKKEVQEEKVRNEVMFLTGAEAKQ